MAGKSLLAPSLAKIQLSDNLKVPLAPGRSLVDWIRHSSTTANLSGTNGNLIKVDEVEMLKHSTEKDAWMVLKGFVYNVTPYLSFHPGGIEELMLGVGKDSTDLFNEVHCWVNYEAMLKPCLVGQYVGSLSKLAKATRKRPGNASGDATTSAVRQESIFYPVSVKRIEKLTHDTRLISLTVGPTYPTVPVGHHILLTASINASDIIRPYTPVLSSIFPDSDGDSDLHLMIKIYQTGVMGSYVKSLKEGDSISVSGPNGNFKLDPLERVDKLLLIAAGTGFTPMAKLISHQLRKNRKVKLLWFNKTVEDIAWKDQMDKLAELNENFTAVHILSKPTDDWLGLRGRVREEIFLAQSVTPSDFGFVCVCGTTEFSSIAAQLCTKLGWKTSEVHLFKL